MARSFVEICAGLHTDKARKHSYETVYPKYFENIRNDVKEMCDLGICRGGSLILWEEYFPNAMITGIDIQELDTDGIPSLSHKRDRNDLYIMDSTDNSLIQKNLGKKTFDIIVDDGSHNIDDQIQTLKNLWPLLKNGGIYVIEDIEEIESFSKFSGIENCDCLDLRKNKGRWDDLIIFITKQETGQNIDSL